MPEPNVTLQQHRYYRSIIVPAIREHCGYVSDAEAHVALKSSFYGISPNDPKLPSMANMSKEEAIRFTEHARIVAAEMGLDIRDPEAPGKRPKADSVHRERIFNDVPLIVEE